MKKSLPAVLILLFTFSLFIFPSSAYAQFNCPATNTSSTAPTVRQNQLDPASPEAQAILSSGGSWQRDEDVTFAGKLAARSQDTLNWLLCNYEWFKLQGGDNPLQALWLYVSYFSYGILGLFILAAAFLMIITRGRSITVKRFIPRFVFILALIVFSFAIVTFLYTLTDYLQGFFINIDSKKITTHDLLNVAFSYKQFEGYRQVDPDHTLAESAVISILLVKLTAATYYTMFVILIIRKVILWFFLLVSPIFPLLLFFKPLRNTAKIWVGEMFRWMLYAPLFAIFLRGLVEIWRSGGGIPLGFNYAPAQDLTSNAEIVYPTAVNILLGGPKTGLEVFGNQSINYVDTFVLYVVALIMLWMVIIVPWILLRIFLDYFYNYNMSESNLAKYLTSPNSPLSPLFHRPPGPPIGPSPAGTPPIPPSPGAAGLARALPMTRFQHSPVAEIQQSIQEAQAQASMQANIQSIGQTARSGIRETASVAQSSLNQSYGQLFNQGSFVVPDAATQIANAEILGLVNLSIPTMRDIAKYETAMLSSGAPGREEISRISEMLQRVAGTSNITSPSEKEKFTRVRERIISQANKGNAVAKSVVSAAKPEVARGVIPQVNRVQQVNLDDYEEIKKTWIDNFRKLEPPLGPDGKPLDRKTWLKQEAAQIPTVIDLLLSGDPQNVEKGMKMVSKILPFLLLGGFSKAEIVAYLKAKLEAAKTVLNEVLQLEGAKEEEESKIETKAPAQAQKTMSASAEIPTDDVNKTDGKDDKKEVEI